MEPEESEDESTDEDDLPIITVLLQSIVATVVMLLEESSSSDEEQQQQQHQMQQPRRRRKQFRPAHAHAFINHFIIGQNPTVDFKLMFRISKERFLHIYNAIEASGNAFFFGQQQAQNNNQHQPPISPAARMMLPIQCLAFGTSVGQTIQKSFAKTPCPFDCSLQWDPK